MKNKVGCGFTPKEKRHLLYENYHPLFICRQRMSKQADAIMGMMLAGQPTILVDRVPDAGGILAVHDACYLEGVRPGQVKQLGGGIQTFLNFLREQ